MPDPQVASYDESLLACDDKMVREDAANADTSSQERPKSKVPVAEAMALLIDWLF